MGSNALLVQDTPETETLSLPNKFHYPEFAGFAGEKRLHAIAEAILPFSLRRTWEIFEREHAYENECFLTLPNVAKRARRTQRTIDRNIATLMSRGLLVLRSEYKVFRNPDGSLRQKAVVVKDFSGFYKLAHEYYLWQQSQDYIEPHWEGLMLLKQDPKMVAKLCRFEDYRRMFELQREPFAQIEPDPRFQYSEDDGTILNGAYRAENAAVQSSGANETLLVSKDATLLSKERINEKAYNNSRNGYSFDSDPDREMKGEASATSTGKNVSAASDYTKEVRTDTTGTTRTHESPTNPVPSPQKEVSPGAGNTRESVEKHPDVLQARQVMAAAGFALSTTTRRQAGTDLPQPPKHPLARSFVHEIAGPFGDLNEKGSKTGIERSIETFELEQPSDVLLCLVRAYIVARDTKAEKIRYHHPETKAPNRMPLFCSMFKTFARALASGSPWEYTWQKMLVDIEADDRLNLWFGEHQAALAGEACTPTETTEAALAPSEPVEGTNEKAGETMTEKEEEACWQELRNDWEQEADEAHEEGKDYEEDEAPTEEVVPGWTDRVVALGHGQRLMQAIADANYTDIEVALREREGRYHVVYKVLVGDVGELVLSYEEDILFLMERAKLGEL
jgi:hypothetical protein